MSESNQKIKMFRPRITRIVVTILLVCITCSSSSAAWDTSGSWLEWLFALFSADDVPQRPVLTEQDHIAIQKAKVLLGSYTADTANSIMLGVLAAADGNETEAHRYFEQAHNLDASDSLLPLTMAAQTYVQEGNFRAAKALHLTVLQESMRRDTSPELQRINAYLDLAVACSKLDEPNEAMNNAEKAERLILASRMPKVEKAFAYLQSGTVYKESLQDNNSALRTWKAGQVLSETAPSRLDPRLTFELNLKLAQNLPPTGPLTFRKQYLKNAEEAANRLTGESNVIAQMRVGEQFAELAIQRIATQDSRALSREAQRLLEPARQFRLDGISPQMMRVKAKAIEAEKSLAKLEDDTAKVNRLKDEMEKVKEGILIQQITPFSEDCIRYNPNALRIVDEGAQGWLLTDGRSRMLMLDNGADARKALALAKRHTHQCFIGRNNRRPNRKDYIVQYWK